MKQKQRKNQTPKTNTATMTDACSVKLDEMASRIGKSTQSLKSIQGSLDLHVPADGCYSEAYCRFMEKIVSLHALHVSRAVIVALFEKEKQILRLQHVDSLGSSPTWYLDACSAPQTKTSLRTCLFLTGANLGCRLDAGAVQDTLDFGTEKKELFEGVEMGEDVRKLIAQYLRQLAAIRTAVFSEVPVVKNALAWAARVLES